MSVRTSCLTFYVLRGIIFGSFHCMYTFKMYIDLQRPTLPTKTHLHSHTLSPIFTCKCIHTQPPLVKHCLFTHSKILLLPHPLQHIQCDRSSLVTTVLPEKGCGWRDAEVSYSIHPSSSKGFAVVFLVPLTLP